MVLLVLQVALLMVHRDGLLLLQVALLMAHRELSTVDGARTKEAVARVRALARFSRVSASSQARDGALAVFEYAAQNDIMPSWSHNIHPDVLTNLHHRFEWVVVVATVWGCRT